VSFASSYLFFGRGVCLGLLLSLFQELLAQALRERFAIRLLGRDPVKQTHKVALRSKTDGKSI
jgi:hypothetical protein